jgi:hypothetical protein
MLVKLNSLVEIADIAYTNNKFDRKERLKPSVLCQNSKMGETKEGS